MPDAAVHLVNFSQKEIVSKKNSYYQHGFRKMVSFYTIMLPSLGCYIFLCLKKHCFHHIKPYKCFCKVVFSLAKTELVQLYRWWSSPVWRKKQAAGSWRLCQVNYSATWNTFKYIIMEYISSGYTHSRYINC